MVELLLKELEGVAGGMMGPLEPLTGADGLRVIGLSLWGRCDEILVLKSCILR